jgi:hypothetical protein
MATRAFTVGAVTLTTAGLVLAMSPAANAATPAPSAPTSTRTTEGLLDGVGGVLGGVTGTVGGVLNGVVGTVGNVLSGTPVATGTTPGTTGTSSTDLGLVTITTGTGGLAVNVPILQTTVGVTTSNGIGVTTAIGSTVAATVGTTPTGVTTTTNTSTGGTGTTATNGGGTTTNNGGSTTTNGGSSSTTNGGSTTGGSDPSAPSNLVVNPSVATTNPTGTPGAVGVHLWATTAYPYKDGYMDTLPLTISAVDTNGGTLAIHGDVVVTSGATSDTTSYSSATGEATVQADVSKLPAGAGTLTVSIAGPNSTTPVTSTYAITIDATAVTSTAVASADTTVYPVKDGYKDTNIFSVKSVTSTGAAVTTTGTAKLYKAGKLVKTWKITKSTQAITWNGRIANVVKTGKYVLKVSLKGPEGATKTATKNITVSGKKLVTKSVTKSMFVGSTKTVHTVKASGGGYCKKLVALTCTGATKTVSTKAATIKFPALAIPAAVKAGQKYGTLQMRITNTSKSVKGKTVLIYNDGKTVLDPVKSGKHTTKWFTFKGTNHKTLGVSIKLGKKSHATVTKSKIEYRYKKLT